jgi:hypothetical protein
MDGSDGAPGQTGPQGPAGQNGSNGQDGVSPTVSVTTITGGHQVSITDAQGTDTFNVMDGSDGAPGQTGATGPQGPAGPAGQNGERGNYTFNAIQDLGDSTTGVNIQYLDVPSGMTVKVNDYIYSPDGNIYVITAISGSFLDVQHLTKLTGPAGPAGNRGNCFFVTTDNISTVAYPQTKNISRITIPAGMSILVNDFLIGANKNIAQIDSVSASNVTCIYTGLSL